MPTTEKQLQVLGSCDMCGVTLRREVFEVGELKFCCSSCHELYLQDDMTQFRQRFGDMMQHMCAICPAEQVKACRDEILATNALIDDFRKEETMHWCPHMEQQLDCSLYDGTVPYEIGSAIIKRSEEIARENGRGDVGITPADYAKAFLENAKNFEHVPNESTYKKITSELAPAEKARLIALNIEVHRSCSVCPTELRKQCDEQLTEEFHDIRRIHKVLGTRDVIWCGHLGHPMGRASGLGVSDENAKKVAANSERIAEEKGHPGVLPQDFYIAFGRTLRDIRNTS